MRYNISKKHSTKGERIVFEVLKELHIPFKHRWLVNGHEVDFIIGNVALEINGHPQSPERNKLMVEAGYVPLHIPNEDINKAHITQLIKLLWQTD